MAISNHKATIGRKLWFWNGQGEGVADAKQAFDATVIFVRDGNSVDLSVTDHMGNMSIWQDVEVHDPAGYDTDCHGNGDEGCMNYATWMPYQKNLMDSDVAKKGK